MEDVTVRWKSGAHDRNLHGGCRISEKAMP